MISLRRCLERSISLVPREHSLFSEEEPITADLMSTNNEPNSLTYVAFARWHHNRGANPGDFNFAVEFLELEDPFEDLTAVQATAIRNLVDTLPQRQRPSTFAVTSPETGAFAFALVRAEG